MKVCVIGDSISEYMDTRIVANAMKRGLMVVPAYSNKEDSSEDEAKEKNKQSYAEIIESELKIEATDIIVIQAGSEDISNLSTAGDSMKYGEYFKQQTIISGSSSLRRGGLKCCVFRCDSMSRHT